MPGVFCRARTRGAPPAPRCPSRRRAAAGRRETRRHEGFRFAIRGVTPTVLRGAAAATPSCRGEALSHRSTPVPPHRRSFPRLRNPAKARSPKTRLLRVCPSPRRPGLPCANHSPTHNRPGSEGRPRPPPVRWILPAARRPVQLSGSSARTNPRASSSTSQPTPGAAPAEPTRVPPERPCEPTGSSPKTPSLPFESEISARERCTAAARFAASMRFPRRADEPGESPQ